LLANIALHGMEQAVQAGYNFKGRDKPKPKLVRYADDLVVFFPTREGIEKAKAVLETWLTDIGLEMKPSKTRIVHTLQALEEEPPGFDFLGFEVRQYPVGKYRSGKHNGKRLPRDTQRERSKQAEKSKDVLLSCRQYEGREG
jgi:RNA-directed DNA polymerase